MLISKKCSKVPKCLFRNLTENGSMGNFWGHFELDFSLVQPFCPGMFLKCPTCLRRFESITDADTVSYRFRYIVNSASLDYFVKWRFLLLSRKMLSEPEWENSDCFTLFFICVSTSGQKTRILNSNCAETLSKIILCSLLLYWPQKRDGSTTECKIF